MFRPAKTTDVKFFKYMLKTPYLTSPLDGGIDQCTRARGDSVFGTRGYYTDKRYMMPLTDTRDDDDSMIN